MVTAKYPSRTILTAAIIAALGAGSAAFAKERLTGEQQLAGFLEGRVAEQPVNCIPLFSIQGNVSVIDNTAIVYGRGAIIYVNRPTNLDLLNSEDVQILRSRTGSICRNDPLEIHDRANHNYEGFVSLQRFVPYRLVANTQ